MAAMNIELLTREVIDAGDSATVISRSRISGQYKNKEIDLVNTGRWSYKGGTANGKSYMFIGLQADVHEWMA